MEPVMRLPARKARPTSVTATARASNLKFLVMRKPTLAPKATREQVSAVIAMGTWKKMILKMAPWLFSVKPFMAMMSLKRRPKAAAPIRIRILLRISPSL
jgi:hypothetical protein